MVKDNNDNYKVNVLLQNNNIITNNINNDNVSNKEKYEASTKAESIARSLTAKFNSEDSVLFYCKIAYALPEYKIWLNYEKATTSKGVKDPARLFNWLCRKDMG